MGEVISGFSIIWIIIFAGYIAGKLGALSPSSRSALSRVVLTVASPCLLFVTISEAEFADVMGAQFGVAALSAVVALSVYAVVIWVYRGRLKADDVMVGGLAASFSNSANLGLPIAAYVLNETALAAPILMFHLAVYIPSFIVVMEVTDRHRINSATGTGTWSSAVRQYVRVALNPIIIGALCGLLFSWQEWRLPQLFQDPVDILAGAAIPLTLLSFGLSLIGRKPLDKHSGQIPETAVAVGVKLVVHPMLTFLCGAYLFGLEGTALMAAVVMASLPSAQNVLVVATRYQVAELMARDTVLLTTIFAVPVMLVVAAGLS